MIKILLVILMPFYSTAGLIWDRIPKDKVDKRILNFIDVNDINNCFQYEENNYNLHLKCLINDKITNIKIIIEDEELVYI